MTPASIHTNKSSSGEPSCAAITLDFLKIPEPITPPTTSITVENNPSVGNKPGRAGDWLDSLMPREFGGKPFERTAPKREFALGKAKFTEEFVRSLHRMNLRFYDAHNH